MEEASSRVMVKNQITWYISFQLFDIALIVLTRPLKSHLKQFMSHARQKFWNEHHSRKKELNIIFPKEFIMTIGDNDYHMWHKTIFFLITAYFWVAVVPEYIWKVSLFPAAFWLTAYLQLTLVMWNKLRCHTHF